MQPWRSPRPEVSELELALWRDLIESRSGNSFPDTRSRFLERCLWQRMEPLGIGSYGDYYRRVVYGPESDAEWRALLELLLNRETGFFRHPPSYEALASRVVPELVAARARQGIAALSGWSAGCSGGQEAYSLAMVLLAGTDPRRWEVSVCGSDLSDAALDEARRGLYRAARTRGVPPDLHHRFLLPVANGAAPCCEVSGELRAAVGFGKLNLACPESYWVGSQDVIFCQNVLIYFRPERRVAIVRRLIDRLKPRGYLFLAPGEVVGLKLPGVRAVHFDNALAYQRVE